MKVITYDWIRIHPYTEEKFFDILPLESYGGVKVYLHKRFCFWVLIENEKGENEILIFPSKEWFDEYYLGIKDKIKILFSSDRLEKKGGENDNTIRS